MFSRTRKSAGRGRLYGLGLSIIIPGGRSLPDLQKAFALRDNPFRPSDFLPGDLRDDLRDLLDMSPLQVAKDERLLPLYCDDVYPAVETPWQSGTPFQNFQSKMRGLGYNDNPKSLDARKRPRIFLIRGPQRTGKATLAHRMMRWLRDCDAAGNTWHDILRWEAPDAAAVTKLRDAIANFGTGRRLLCLIEDVGVSAETEVFKVFNISKTERPTLIFFMTSSDHGLLQKSANEYQIQEPSVIAYETRTLNPSRAIKYCKHRMDLVRPAGAPAWLARYPFFPFTEEIITSCISSEGDRSGRQWKEMGTIDIAKLNVKFADALDGERNALPADFDIATVAEADVPNHFLDPWPEAGREQVA
jgi:hypothetical protein